MTPKKNNKGEELSFIEGVFALAQYVEYKIFHYIDKVTESLFGFISVLPGAFSTFRWRCIQGEPLEAFLRGAKGSKCELSFNWFQSNMYLAEDRIMCLEIICKEDEKWIMNYVPGAVWLTDPPLSLTSLIKQRRRWFNGSFFATLHVIMSIWKVWRRQKSFLELFRIMFLFTYFIYMIINMIMSFILVGSFYSAFSILLRATFSTIDCSVVMPAYLFENLYLIWLFFILMLSTTVNIMWAEFFFRATSVIMGVFTLLTVCLTIYYYICNGVETKSIIFLGIILISYFLPLLTNFRNIKMGRFMKGILYVIYMAPTYINIITIYSFCNINDISWGSRPVSAYEKILDKDKVILFI